MCLQRLSIGLAAKPTFPRHEIACMRFLILFILCIGFGYTTFGQLLLEDDRVVISNEINVNSTDLDFSPMYYRDGVVYLTTNVQELKYRVEDKRAGVNIAKLYQATRSYSGVLSDVQPFYRELSSSFNEGPVTFDTSFNKIYFTRNDDTRKKKRRKRKEILGLRIYTADFENDSWVNERMADFNVSDANTAHPALAPDGNLLVFASNRKGGYGEMDLWAVKKIGGEWGEAYNLGPDINTEGNDVFPFLHADGTLYYSSTTQAPSDEEGHLDIYYSRLSGSKWGKGISLGPPFNSDDDDFGFIVAEDNKKGYFSSDRVGGLGGDDIYSFQIFTDRIGGPLDLTVVVSDARSGIFLEGAKVTYLNTADVSLARALSDGLISGNTETGLQLTGGKSTTTDGEGRRVLNVSSGEYLLSIEKEGYATIQLPLSLNKGSITLPVALDPVAGCGGLRIVVLDEKSLLPVSNARIRLDGQSTGKSVDLNSNGDGESTYCVPCGDIYGITAILGAQRSSPAAFDTRGQNCRRGDEATLTLYLKSPGGGGGGGRSAPSDNPLVVGSVLQLPSVYYPLDAYDLSMGARNDLNHLAVLLNRYPGMRIELGSHTDAQGSAEYNLQLSQRRASEAKRYLVQEAQISSSRISAIGYGEREIRNRCVDGVRCSSAEHRQNRRTEIKVVHVDNPVAISDYLQQKASEGRRDEYAAPQRGSTSVSSSTSDLQVTDGKRYWVVAGTFRENSNASKRLAELESLGYVGVSVLSFPGETTHVVVCGKFGQLAEAAQFSRALKEAHEIGAYVRKVK